MNDESPPLRFKYSGSYTDPEKHDFGSGDWMSEDDCREAVCRMLSDPAVRSDSIKVVVQQKKSRWLSFKLGSAEELFPDIAAKVAKKAAIDASRE